MDHGNPRATAEEVESGLYSRVLAADHNHVAVVEEMGFAVVVRHMRQVFAGNVHHVRIVVIADGENNVTRIIAAKTRQNAENMTFRLLDPQDFFVLVHVELVSADDFPVVLERLVSRGLLAFRHERYTTDLKQFRCCEKNHLYGEVQNRIGDPAFIDDDAGQSILLRFQSTGQPGGPGAYDNS